ncbi:ParB/Srx family N-terminal domain-containing protein [Parasphingorhabdus sp.]|uniref:ParB/Srx family N-terminal domain-containing protein n=1 Tax=Parasphingorhabdus sp. TaxID=2709688 RepID=UPI003A93177C
MPKSHTKSKIPSRLLAFSYVPIDEVIVYADNPNTHTRAQIKKLQRSMRKFGWTNPLLIDDAGNLVCGHGRLEAARLNGETHVPVINLGEMNELDRRAYIITDNRLAQDAKWSKKLLRSELSGLIDLGYEVELTGFDTFEIDGILSIGEEEPEDEDNVELPANDAVPVARNRDFWKVGNQWLLMPATRRPSSACLQASGPS